MIEIAAPMQIIEMPHMKKIKLNSKIKYLSTFAQLASPILYFFLFFYKQAMKHDSHTKVSSYYESRSVMNTPLGA